MVRHPTGVQSYPRSRRLGIRGIGLSACLVAGSVLPTARGANSTEDENRITTMKSVTTLGRPARKAKDIFVRDPFIHTDESTETYYMYASAGRPHGVKAYASKDLENWSDPERVLVIPDDEGVSMVWAPEMHAHKGAYYLFVTLTYEGPSPTHKRGTHIFRADNPLGPFERLREGPHTPADWMADWPA